MIFLKVQIQILICYSHYTMFGLSEGYQQLWKAIIRPPRAQYMASDLGQKVYKTKGLKIQRKDIEITNKQNLKLQCSHYEPYIRPSKQMPCVIYLHGNSSCRLQGARIVHYLISRNITVFAFDFAGCGLSEGQYISLGYFQRDDVDCVFKYLRNLGTVSSIGIWGRSMGAVTALMYADSNHQIGCLVLDSPFSNLQKLSKQLADKHGGGLSIFSGIALSFLKSTIKQKHKFNIEDLDPLGNHVKNAYIPAFFIHGKDDVFILPSHSQALHQAYSGQKKIKIVQGYTLHNNRDHNSPRPSQILEEISTFFYYGLCVGDLVKQDKVYMQQQKKQRKGIKEQKAEHMQQGVNFDKVFGVGPQLMQYNEQEQQLRMALQLSLSLAQQNKGKQSNK